MSEEIEIELAQKLDILRSQPARNPAKESQGRAVFMAQAQAMANSLPQSVTKEEQARHIGWMHPLRLIFPMNKRKEQTPMLSALGTILLIVSLILGGSGVTVVAAQNSQPDQMLYPVKTWSEDVRVQMSSNTQSRLELALEYSQRRAEEMKVMLTTGQVPPDAVQARMQAEIDLSLRLAAGQPDGDTLKSLQQIRQQLQEQARLLELPGWSGNAGPNGEAQAAALLERTRVMLQDRLHLCDLGLQNPAVLRDQLRKRDRLQDGALAPTTQATNGAGAAGIGNPWLERTPTPGSGYGPGSGDGPGTAGSTDMVGGGNNPWTTGTPTPGSGFGPGPGDGSGTMSGNNPWTTGTPTPGSSYGPGPRNGAGIGTGSGGSDSGGTGGYGAGSGSGAGGSYGGSGSGPSDGSGAGSGCGACGGSGEGTGGQGAGGHGEGGPGGHH